VDKTALFVDEPGYLVDACDPAVEQKTAMADQKGVHMLIFN
jgi:hypothetical protein